MSIHAPARRPYGAVIRLWAGPCPTPMRAKLTPYDMETLPATPCRDHYHVKRMSVDALEAAIKAKQDEGKAS